MDLYLLVRLLETWLWTVQNQCPETSKSALYESTCRLNGLFSPSPLGPLLASIHTLQTTTVRSVAVILENFLSSTLSMFYFQHSRFTPLFLAILLHFPRIYSMNLHSFQTQSSLKLAFWAIKSSWIKGFSSPRKVADTPRRSDWYMIYSQKWSEKSCRNILKMLLNSYKNTPASAVFTGIFFVFLSHQIPPLAAALLYIALPRHH